MEVYFFVVQACVEFYRWSIELEGIFVLPLAPHWVRHSYLSKESTIDPLYLWVINVHGGLYPTHACTQCLLILMHVHDCCRSLVGRFPVSSSLHLY